MWTPHQPLPTDLERLFQETFYVFPLHWRTLARAFRLCFQRRRLLADLFRRIVSQGRESYICRAKGLLQTWLGAYYALLLRQQGGVKHIHVHHGYFAAWVAMVAARLLGISFTMTLHGSDLLVDGTFLDTKLENCAACFTISEFNRQYIRRHFPRIDAGRIRLRRLGVEIPKLDVSRRGRTGQLFTILSAARLHSVKNQAFLLDACSILRQRGINFLCLIAGDGPERDRLCRQVSRLGLQSEVKLLGHVVHSDLEELYALVDVVVLTSRSEGIPLVLMEAMAHATPVLAPNITGIPELVEDGVTGFLYKPGSRADFVSRLELIRETAAALGPLCQAARQRVLTDFNLERNRQQFLDDLLNIIFPGQSLACLGMGDKRSAHDISEPDGHEDSLLQ